MPIKRVASSPPSAEPDKKVKKSLTQDELDTLNNIIALAIGKQYAEFTTEDLPMKVLHTTLILTVTTLNAKGCKSTVNTTFMNFGVGEERLQRLSAEERRNLASVWIEARDRGDWERFSNYPIFQQDSPMINPLKEDKPHPRERDEQKTATEKSWNYPFKGNAAVGLWEYIKSHYKYDPVVQTVYAHYTSIIQSSGMGKSRTVDELAKDHFVIPVNLQEDDNLPADYSVRNYLINVYSKNEAFERACTFLEALFIQTLRIISTYRNLNYAKTAEQFRSSMAHSQKAGKHNAFRDTFYKNVIDTAGKLLKTRQATPEQTSRFSPYIAMLELAQRLEGDHSESLLTNTEGKQRAGYTKSPDSIPLVILAFEAHKIGELNKERSILCELQEALQKLNNLPLFSLFLSRTVIPTPAEREGRSPYVMVHNFTTAQPHTDPGLDPLAPRIPLDGSWNLERLTDMSHICSLGRPLFGSWYQMASPSAREEIILSVAAMLLDADYGVAELSDDQTLACLSQRIPLEFGTCYYVSKDIERKQVEDHMRVCFQIDAASDSMLTLSPSEPVLSEAAYYIMQKKSFRASDALKSAMDHPSISKGDRGEFLVLLVLTLARDMAVGPADTCGWPAKKRYWFGLVNFLYKVFQKSPSMMSKKSRKALNRLAEDFPHASLHFNHFVKVYEFDITSLLLLSGRGAAVLCANNQRTVDAVNVFLKDGTKLARDNAGLILHQIRNDPIFSKKPRQISFDAMNPYDLGILEEGSPAVPLIKVVFALAAKEPHLTVARRPPGQHYDAVVYEIWCAGISPDILGPVKEGQVSTWDALLEASYGWKEPYRNAIPVLAELRRSAAPGAAGDEGHYANWA